jgi:tellurite methyltransferase
MNDLRLVPYRYLDPRELEASKACPIAAAVNIPFTELPERRHELPSRDSTLQVAAEEPMASQVVQWLRTQGRQAEISTDFVYAPGMAAGEIGRLWSPNAFLEEYTGQIGTPGRALDLACGSGREAVYLKACGWQVTAVDRLPDALQRGKALEQRYAPGTPAIEWLEIDLERDPPAFTHPFELITLFLYFHRPLPASLQNWLAPGGSVLIETFTTLHRDRHSRPASDKLVLQPGEIQTLLPELFILHVSEQWHGEKHTVRFFARDEMRKRIR